MQPAIVSDIGGTHARFGLADLSQPIPVIASPRTFLCAEHPSLDSALAAYASTQGMRALPDAMAVAIAGPVVQGAARLTNAHWEVSEATLRAAGFRAAVVMNDFGALALSTPCLGDGDVGRIGPALQAVPGKPVTILGAGTGFGVAVLAPAGSGRETLIETEGGHIAFAPVDALEIELLVNLQRRFGRVSIERILSGPGIHNLYCALGEVLGGTTPCETPASVTKAAQEGDALAMQTLERFCDIFGSVAGDFALSYGAHGGVFIGGGIAPRLLDILQRGGFRSRFEAKGRFQPYAAAIPTAVVTHPYAALVGAARGLKLLLEA